MKTINKVYLSLATISLLSSSSLSASATLEKFLNDGEINGEVKVQYFDRDNGQKSEGLLSLGLGLYFSSADYNGFKFNVGFQSSHAPFVSDDESTDDLYNKDQNGSGEVLSVFNLSYAHKDSLLEVGRMYLDMPSLFSSNNMMVRESFEAVKFTNKSIPNTKVEAVYVERYQAKSDKNGNIGKFEKEDYQKNSLDDGAYSIVITTKPIENLEIVGSYLDKVDYSNVGFAQVEYSHGIFDFGTQYWYSKRDLDNESAGVITAKAGVKLSNTYLQVAASQSEDNGEHLDFGMNKMTNRLFYPGSPILSLDVLSDTQMYQALARHVINPGTWVMGVYTYQDVNEDSNFKGEYDYMTYGFGHEFKGGFLDKTEFKVLYEEGGKDSDEKELRMYLTHKF